MVQPRNLCGSRYAYSSVPADKRARDDASDEIFADQHFSRDLADAIQLFERDHLFVRRDLKDAVRARIDDRFACAHVFIAEFLNDLRAACHDIAECTATDTRFKRVHQFLRESVRIRLERFVQRESRHLPMSAGRILCMRLLRTLAVTARQGFVFLRKKTAVDMRKSEFFHVRNVERSAFFPDVADRVCTRVAEIRGIRKLADPGAVKYDQNCSFLHTVTSMLNLNNFSIETVCSSMANDTETAFRFLSHPLKPFLSLRISCDQSYAFCDQIQELDVRRRIAKILSSKPQI